jgi:signal-transduction protein with cAMP-binding, CBS, and nucleotidyltransferase domain
MACRIDKLVAEHIASLPGSTDVQTAAAYMAERDIGSLIVTTNDEVIGLFTERDLLKRVIGAGNEASALKLSDVCTRNLISLPHDSSCAYAIKLMKSNRCRRLLVHHHGHFQGLVNIQDVANALADHSTGKNLLVNLVGGLTLIVVLAVIGMLIFHFPDMMALADQTLD